MATIKPINKPRRRNRVRNIKREIIKERTTKVGNITERMERNKSLGQLRKKLVRTVKKEKRFRRRVELNKTLTPRSFGARR